MKKSLLLGVALFSLSMIGPLHAQGVIGPGGPYGLTPNAGPPPYDSYGPAYYGYRGAPVPYRAESGGPYAMMPERESYCAQRYRSYDPASGTYLGRGGRRYPCR